MNWPLQTGPEKVNKTGIYQKSRWQMCRQGYEIKKKEVSSWEELFVLFMGKKNSITIFRRAK